MATIDPDKKGGAFMTGMFSMLDAIMDSNLPDLLDPMPIAPEIKEALLEGNGIYGDILQGTLAYERGDWEMIDSSDIDKSTISNSYIQAVKWATQASSLLNKSPTKAA
jgi:EAL and modified HD-GYP domain-containing signal transduction protein